MLGRACRCWLPLEVAHVVGAWVSYRTRPPPPPAFQAWAQSTCPELSAQGLVPLRWGCALPSPNVQPRPEVPGSQVLP